MKKFPKLNESIKFDGKNLTVKKVTEQKIYLAEGQRIVKSIPINEFADKYGCDKADPNKLKEAGEQEKELNELFGGLKNLFQKGKEGVEKGIQKGKDAVGKGVDAVKTAYQDGEVKALADKITKALAEYKKKTGTDFQVDTATAECIAEGVYSYFASENKSLLSSINEVATLTGKNVDEASDIIQNHLKNLNQSSFNKRVNIPTTGSSTLYKKLPSVGKFLESKQAERNKVLESLKLNTVWECQSDMKVLEDNGGAIDLKKGEKVGIIKLDGPDVVGSWGGKKLKLNRSDFKPGNGFSKLNEDWGALDPSNLAGLQYGIVIAATWGAIMAGLLGPLVKDWALDKFKDLKTFIAKIKDKKSLDAELKDAPKEVQDKMPEAIAQAVSGS